MTGLGRLLVVVVALLLAVAPVAAPPLAASQPASIPFLRVQIDSVTPDVVTTTSEQMVTVTGTVSNVGDRAVRDVVVRLARAPDGHSVAVAVRDYGVGLKPGDASRVFNRFWRADPARAGTRA